MAFYQSADELKQVMTKLFDRLNEDPSALNDFLRSKMVVRFSFVDPQLEAVISGKSNPISVVLGPYEGRPDLDLHMPADVIHNVWLGNVRLRDAFMSGQIKVTGNIFRAMQLADLFRKAEAEYPRVLAELDYQLLG